MEKEPNFEGEVMKSPAETINATEVSAAETQTKGAFIIGLILALVVILVGIYYWYSSSLNQPVMPLPNERPTAEMNQEPETTTAAAQVESFGAMSTSDEINAIEADIESTNLENLELELNQIDAELEAAIEQI
jgi:cytochrome bd-type quinol oxidase subunit 1